jgi:hypothetical protein
MGRDLLEKGLEGMGERTWIAWFRLTASGRQDDTTKNSLGREVLAVSEACKGSLREGLVWDLKGNTGWSRSLLVMASDPGVRWADLRGQLRELGPPR